jgi:putative hemolysin
VVAPRDGRVVGVISLFDLLGLDGGEKLGSVMHPPFFAKDGEPATKLLLRMKEEALHMAIVENVRGEALGIITLENILESIVGDIQDEYG